MLVSVEQGVAATWDAAVLEPRRPTAGSTEIRPGQPGRPAGRGPGPRRLCGGGQGGDPGPRGHGLHLGARRPHPPAPGHHPPPVDRGHRPAPGGSGPAGPGRPAPAPVRRAAARGRGAPGRAHAQSSPPSPPSRTRSSSGGPWPTTASSPRTGPHRGAVTPVAVEQLVIDQVLRRGRAPSPQSGRGRLGPAHHHGPRHPGADRAVGGPDPRGASSSGASSSASRAPAPTWPR